MIAIICIDNKNGMAFNKRRQARDAYLRKRIREITKGKRLLMSEYSAEQFESTAGITADDKFLIKAQSGDYCFIETERIAKYENAIEKLIIYKWNRDYPADLRLDIDLRNYKLISSENFEGNSHTITEEIYIKE